MSLGVRPLLNVADPSPWIDYRESLARLIDRADAPACAGCGCELDVFPVPHSPRCKEAVHE